MLLKLFYVGDIYCYHEVLCKLPGVILLQDKSTAAIFKTRVAVLVPLQGKSDFFKEF